jgi:hypothetical protein
MQLSEKVLKDVFKTYFAPVEAAWNGASTIDQEIMEL